MEFDENDNLITKKTINTPPTKETYKCKYCNNEWDNKNSKSQHERWCEKNPNKRKYTKRKPKPKLIDTEILQKLKAFDKDFGLTDSQIVKYIRNYLKGVN